MSEFFEIGIFSESRIFLLVFRDFGICTDQKI